MSQTLDQPVEATDQRKAPVWRSPRARILIVVSSAIVLIWAGYSLYQYLSYGRFQVSTDNAYLAADSVAIAPRVEGLVAEMLVAEGEDVAAGAALVRLDRAPLGAELDRRRADLARAEAELERQAAEINLAQAQEVEAQSAARLARSEAARYAQLASLGAEARDDQERYAAAAQQALARRSAAAARRQSAVEQAQALRAGVDQARAAVRQAELDFAAGEIRAPRAGRVGDLGVRVGQYVQPGTRLLTLVPTGELYLVANFKETQIARMRPGQRVRIDLDALPDLDIEGELESIAPGTGAEFALIAPDNATGNFTKIVQRVPVRVRLSAPRNAGGRLIAGLSATVEVDTRDD